MGKNKFTVNFILILTLASCFLIHDSRAARAQELSVGIYPPILQIQTDPPASIKAGISIENKSDQTTTYNIYLVPFRSSIKDNGEPDFDNTLTPLYEDFFSKVQVIDGTHVIQKLTLAPKQKKSLTLHIGLPKGEPPMDYYFSVLFISDSGNQAKQDSSIAAQGGIGTNVLVSVGPKSPARGAISEFSASSFVTKGPVNFKLAVFNTGLSYFAPKGNVVIKDMFGQTVGQVNIIPVNILSSSQRFMPSKGSNDQNQPRVVWNQKFLLGIYHAEASVAISDQGPIVKKTLTFLAIPIEGILGILLAIAIVVGITRRIKAKEKETY